MNNLFRCLLSIYLLSATVPLYADNVIRTTGDTSGISFAEQTRNARPINGNVRGVSFSQWVTGRKMNLDKKVLLSSGHQSHTYHHSYYRDTTRVLSSEDEKLLKKLRQNEGILISD